MNNAIRFLTSVSGMDQSEPIPSSDDGMDAVEVGDDVILVPAIHISQQTGNRVEKAIEEYDPDSIAVELDPERLESHSELGESSQSLITNPLSDAKEMFDKNVPLKRIPLMLYLLYQQELSTRLLGDAEPGIGMKTAVAAAKRDSRDLHLIDLDFAQSLDELSEELISLNGVSIITGRFSNALTNSSSVSGFVNRFTGPRGDIEEFEERIRSIGLEPSRLASERLGVFEDLSYEETVELRAIIEEGYPLAYDKLIEHRDYSMAAEIEKIRQGSETVLVVLGKAHIPGIADIISGETSF